MESIEKRGVIFGAATTAGLIAYFSVMNVFGLSHNFNLRAFNAIIMFFGVFLSIKTYKDFKGKQFEFLKGAGTGLITSLVTATLFTVFFSLYIYLDPAFYAEIKAEEPQGIYMNAWGIAALIFIEAVASGFLFTYLSMQWLKKSGTEDLYPRSSIQNK